MASGALREGTLEVAHDIAATAPIAVRLTKAGLALGPRSLDDVIAWEALAQPITMASEDLKEGMRAAQEKRPPAFRGV
jgi:enoyl-CoA hydratase